MSPKLKELRLPQMVEMERKLHNIAAEESDRAALMTAQSQDQDQQPVLPQQQTAFVAQFLPLTTQHPPPRHVDDAPAANPPPSYPADSSSPDITSPITPTFSTRGHQRGSSSASSLDFKLPPLATHLSSTPLQHPQHQFEAHTAPSSPTTGAIPPTGTLSLQLSGPKSIAWPLAKVKEESLLERDAAEDQGSTPETSQETEEDDTLVMADHFSLYDCLCDTPCEHRISSDGVFPVDYYSEIDYDYGFLSDGDYPPTTRAKKRSSDSPFFQLTSKFGSRIGSLQRWKTSRRDTNLMSSPTTGMSLENVMSHGPSTRASSESGPGHPAYDRSVPPTPSMSYYGSTESIDMPGSRTIGVVAEGQETLERDRSMATTPLLPPLMTNPFEKPHQPGESPLQSPTVAPSSAAPEIHSPPMTASYHPRPSLSTRPSLTSLTTPALNGTFSGKLAELPAFLQEQDSWSDALGHANFTITPVPYTPAVISTETVQKFVDDWNLARVNYTRHLVRTGENYGATSNIYALTEEKWNEIECMWRDIHAVLTGESQRPSIPIEERRTRPRASSSLSRSRSRGPQQQPRSRSGSATGLPVIYSGHNSRTQSRRPSQDEFANAQWRQVQIDRDLKDFTPRVVTSQDMKRSSSQQGQGQALLTVSIPEMLAAPDSEGKFPERGDEDIVGPMVRDPIMKGREKDSFWGKLVTKVGIKS